MSPPWSLWTALLMKPIHSNSCLLWFSSSVAKPMYRVKTSLKSFFRAWKQCYEKYKQKRSLWRHAQTVKTRMVNCFLASLPGCVRAVWPEEQECSFAHVPGVDSASLPELHPPLDPVEVFPNTWASLKRWKGHNFVTLEQPKYQKTDLTVTNSAQNTRTSDDYFPPGSSVLYPTIPVDLVLHVQK